MHLFLSLSLRLHGMHSTANLPLCFFLNFSAPFIQLFDTNHDQQTLLEPQKRSRARIDVDDSNAIDFASQRQLQRMRRIGRD
jgi:hypothetical protein